MKASWKRATSLLLVALMAWWCLSTTHAGKILTFVCSATQTDPDTGEKTPCAFESKVEFGGGKLSKTLTGFCWSCSKFVYLRWTREGIDPKRMVAMGLEYVSKPTPVATLWDGVTGKTLPSTLARTAESLSGRSHRRNTSSTAPSAKDPHSSPIRRNPCLSLTKQAQGVRPVLQPEAKVDRATE